jgi:pyrroloquinoline quinone biosynthesis protein B
MESKMMDRIVKLYATIFTGLALAACGQSSTSNPTISTAVNCSQALAVLGVAQDAGKPQISVHGDAAWTDPSRARLPTSLGLIDRTAQTRYLFDASPKMKRQLYNLDQIDDGRGFALDGVFLTHGHMGHYLGLAHLGREAMGAKSIPVYTMPRMSEFLQNNGPWDQLVALKNIEIRKIKSGDQITLSKALTVTPFAVNIRKRLATAWKVRMLARYICRILIVGGHGRLAADRSTVSCLKMIDSILMQHFSAEMNYLAVT